MNIGGAVEAMQEGAKVSRPGWNGKGMWIAIHEPKAKARMTQPYVYMKTAQGDYIPWLCSQADLLADDWEIVSG